MRRIVVGLVGSAMVALMNVACEPCVDETTYSLRVSLESMPGHETMWTQHSYSKADWSNHLPADVAISDASSDAPGWLFFSLSDADMTVGMALPLPTAIGQTFPVVARREVLSHDDFSLLALTSPAMTIFPRDAIAAFSVTHVEPGCPPQTSPTPDACAISNAADLRQSLSGAFNVLSIKPLRLQADVTVSYPAESARPSKLLTGEVKFASTKTEFCVPHT